MADTVTFSCPTCSNSFTVPADRAGEDAICNGLNVKADENGTALTYGPNGEQVPITGDGQPFIFVGMNGEELNAATHGIGIKDVHHHSPTVMRGSKSFEGHHRAGGVAIDEVGGKKKTTRKKKSTAKKTTRRR